MKAYLAFFIILLFAGCTQEVPQQDETDSKMIEIEEKLEEIEETVEELEVKVEELEEEVEEMKNGKNESEPVQVEEDEEMHTFLVKIENVHDSVVLSPGVFVAHKPPFSINYINKQIPSEMEPLAEYGDNAPFYDYVSSQEGAIATYSIDTALAPGESTTFILKVPRDRPRETYLSGVMMLVQTNDGFALANNIALFTQGNGPKQSTTNAQNYDAGTEENSPVGSGFTGGQPDPSQGEENIDNGTPSVPQKPVIPHTQVVESVMRVTITPQSY
jgi:outer membrane murein-binding lipoprotein Lpp